MARRVVVHAAHSDFSKPTVGEWLRGRDMSRANWDVFSDDPSDTAESLGLYDMADCPHAVAFAKDYPELRYIGSEDNLHLEPHEPPKES
jgi:hypothetical protein